MPRAKNFKKTVQETTIYLGPSLPSGQLARYTTFRNGEPLPHVKMLIDECPAMKFLIVPVSKLAETERKLKESASVESSRFADINKHFKKGAK